MSVTIWHNPACGTSRNALALIREVGHEPEVIDYVRTGWDRTELAALLAQAGLTPREALRERGTPAAELGLLEPGVSDDAILDAMLAHPILVQRPLVRTPRGAVLARPAEAVLPLLEPR
jgi:arsenate reductase